MKSGRRFREIRSKAQQYSGKVDRMEVRQRLSTQPQGGFYPQGTPQSVRPFLLWKWLWEGREHRTFIMENVWL